METQTNNLGEPDLQFGAFQVWIHGRQFPKLMGSDADWLMITLKCSDDNSETWVKNEPVIRLTELKLLLEQLHLLCENKVNQIHYFHYEPELDFSIKVVPSDKIEMAIDIMPDTTKEPHRYLLFLERSQLLAGIQDLDKIFTKYPILEKY